MIASEYFAKYIDKINNNGVKKFMRLAIDKFPPYFMTVPASSTGKYHCDWSNVIGSDGAAGGLAKHTYAMCWYVDQMAEAEMLTPEEKDAALVAVMFHDAVKYGFGGGKFTTKTHEAEGAVFFQRCLKQFKAEALPLADVIHKAILFHQGRWAVSDPPKMFPVDFDTVGQMVHRADMVVSRKEFKADIFPDDQSLIG